MFWHKFTTVQISANLPTAYKVTAKMCSFCSCQDSNEVGTWCESNTQIHKTELKWNPHPRVFILWNSKIKTACLHLPLHILKRPSWAKIWITISRINCGISSSVPNVRGIVAGWDGRSTCMGIDPKLSKQIGENGFLNKDDQWNWFKQNKKYVASVRFPYGICWIDHEKGPSRFFFWVVILEEPLKFDCHFLLLPAFCATCQ